MRANSQRMPLADLWDWQTRSRCRGVPSDQFFHPDGAHRGNRAREASAKRLCADCPVRAECAAHALNTKEPYGVWGGFTESERLRLLAIGWEHAADRYRRRVDVNRLQALLTRAKRKPAPAVRL